MSWIINNDLPIHQQLVDELTRRIITGDYPKGSRIPSVRDLALEAKVNPNTMQKALNALEEKAIIHTQRTSGKYVTDQQKIIDKLQAELANQLVSEFTSHMKKLGFNETKTIQTIKERWQ